MNLILRPLDLGDLLFFGGVKNYPVVICGYFIRNTRRNGFNMVKNRYVVSQWFCSVCSPPKNKPHAPPIKVLGWWFSDFGFWCQLSFGGLLLQPKISRPKARWATLETLTWHDTMKYCLVHRDPCFDGNIEQPNRDHAHLSHEIKPALLSLNPGCLIGILIIFIMVY